VNKLTVKVLNVLLAWHCVKKVGEMCREEEVKKWVEIHDSESQPPPFNRWSDEDEAELINASKTDLGICDTAVGRLEKKRVSDLKQAAIKMSDEEWAEIKRLRRSHGNEE